jgi:hypothetical protein
MKQSPGDSAHATPLKIRLPETLRQQLLNGVAGKSFNRVIVERLEADSGLDDDRVDYLMRDWYYGEVYYGMSTALAIQELQYRDVNVVIRALSNVGMMLVPGSTLLRSVRPRSAAHRFLEGACDKIRAALDIILDVQRVMEDHAPTDAEAEMAAAPLPRCTSRMSTLPVDPPRPQHATDMTYELPRQSGRPREEREPGNVVEVKIRLPEILRQQLAAEASRNKRTLTAEIRVRLERSCAFEIFKSEIVPSLRAAAEKVLSVRQLRMGFTTDKLCVVIDALETAQAVLNPLTGLLRSVRLTSSAARELEGARNQIRTALVAIQRLLERVEGNQRPTSQRHRVPANRSLAE